MRNESGDQPPFEIQSTDVAAGEEGQNLDANHRRVASSSISSGGQFVPETRILGVAETGSGHTLGEFQNPDAAPGPSLAETIALIRAMHRDHRHALKTQSRLDRSLEAHIRVNMLGFSTMMPEAERAKISRQALAIVKDCRAGNQSTEHDLVAMMVLANDRAREAWDSIESDRRRALERLARTLPGYAFVRETRGAGDLGFAQIIAEAGDLSRYANPGKLWKRLGFAPYEGSAMSTWIRTTWRPRSLTADEWTANPFKPERYALMMQIATWLRNAQWIGKAKDPEGVGKPNGHYGEVYASRRAHTKQTHPEWTDGHANSDALRYLMKRFLRDLWVAWRQEATGALEPIKPMFPAENSQIERPMRP